MQEPNVDNVERRLAGVLEKERREAIVYVILTVVLTPVFVIVAALIVTGVAGYVFVRDHVAFDLDAVAFFTTINGFLAYVVVFVLANSGSRWPQVRFDGMWIAGTAVFLVLLTVTYATELLECHPSWLAAGYGIGGFLILGLMGQVRLADHVTTSHDGRTSLLAFLLAVSGFVLAAYGELRRDSWLWTPPKPDEVHVEAWVMCRLAFEMSGPSAQDPMHRRVVDVLRRLGFLQETEGRLELTPKGLDFVGAGGQTGA